MKKSWLLPIVVLVTLSMVLTCCAELPGEEAVPTEEPTPTEKPIPTMEPTQTPIMEPAVEMPMIQVFPVSAEPMESMEDPGVLEAWIEVEPLVQAAIGGTDFAPLVRILREENFNEYLIHDGEVFRVGEGRDRYTYDVDFFGEDLYLLSYEDWDAEIEDFKEQKIHSGSQTWTVPERFRVKRLNGGPTLSASAWEREGPLLQIWRMNSEGVFETSLSWVGYPLRPTNEMWMEEGEFQVWLGGFSNEEGPLYYNAVFMVAHHRIVTAYVTYQQVYDMYTSRDYFVLEGGSGQHFAYVWIEKLGWTDDKELVIGSSLNGEPVYRGEVKGYIRGIYFPPGYVAYLVEYNHEGSYYDLNYRYDQKLMVLCLESLETATIVLPASEHGRMVDMAFKDE